MTGWREIIGPADVLRDLSWLPEGPVTIELPELHDMPRSECEMMLNVLAEAVAGSLGSPRPLHVHHPGGSDG